MVYNSRILDTPIKARLKGVAEFNDAHQIPYFRTQLFRYYGVKPRIGYRILAEDNQAFDRTRAHNTATIDRRGRPPQLSEAQIHEADRFLQAYGWDARVLTWEQLAEELDFGVSGRVLKNALRTMDYSKCIACSKGWISQHHARRRLEYCKLMLERYPKPEDWWNVRFSDEVH